MKLLIKCPKCGYEQTYTPRKRTLITCRRKCHRCEKSFNVHNNINDTTIIKELR